MGSRERVVDRFVRYISAQAPSRSASKAEDAAILKAVSQAIERNKDKWSWLAGLTEAQLETIAKRVTADIAKELRSSNRRMKRLKLEPSSFNYTDQQVEMFVQNLSRGHAGFLRS